MEKYNSLRNGIPDFLMFVCWVRIPINLNKIIFILFIIYVTTLLAAQRVQSRVVQWLVLNEVQNTWKKSDVAWSEVLQKSFPGETETDTKNLSQNSWFPGRKFNAGFP